MRIILQYLLGETARSIAVGVALVGVILFVGQYLGDEDVSTASFQERIAYSVSNLSELADSAINSFRRPASEIKQKIKLAQLKNEQKSEVKEGYPQGEGSAVGKFTEIAMPDEDSDIGTTIYSGKATNTSNLSSSTSSNDADNDLTKQQENAQLDNLSHKPADLNQDTVSIAVNTTQGDIATAGVSTTIESSASDISNSSSGTLSLTVNADKASGSYNSSLAITLTSSDTGASIYYCLAEACCDPLGTSGVQYSAPVTVGESDGSYCLSVVALDSGVSSETVDYHYTISTTLPDVSQSIDVVQIQSNERSWLQVSSSDMGTDGFFLTQLNIGSSDPAGTDCPTLLTSYPSSSYGLLEENLNTSEIDMGGGRSPASIFSFPVSMETVQYGDNYLVSIVENSNVDGSLYSCPALKVILKDFAIYSAELGVDHSRVTASDSSMLSGGFSGYGGFGTTSNISLEGRVNPSSSKFLESGFINIIN